MKSGSAFLDQMMASKRSEMAEVSAAAREQVRERAMEQIAGKPKHRLFQALQREGVNIIAEVKRSSPSAGAIRRDAGAVEIALKYQAAGAAAISVLTESGHFSGSLEDLVAVARQVAIPVLRKDFVVDAHQIHEAAAAGAAAVLLIVAGLRQEEFSELRQIAEDELGLDALVETHNAEEIGIAREAGAKLIGVNNRNLQTLEVSLATSRELAAHIGGGALFISESGLKTSHDIDDLARLGYRGFLIGETLMRAADPMLALRELSMGAAR